MMMMMMTTMMTTTTTTSFFKQKFFAWLRLTSNFCLSYISSLLSSFIHFLLSTIFLPFPFISFQLSFVVSFPLMQYSFLKVHILLSLLCDFYHNYHLNHLCFILHPFVVWYLNVLLIFRLVSSLAVIAQSV
jgi:hypothetical protein